MCALSNKALIYYYFIENNLTAVKYDVVANQGAMNISINGLLYDSRSVCVYPWILPTYIQRCTPVPCIVSVAGIDLSTDTIPFNWVLYCTVHTPLQSR